MKKINFSKIISSSKGKQKQKGKQEIKQKQGEKQKIKKPTAKKIIFDRRQKKARELLKKAVLKLRKPEKKVSAIQRIPSGIPGLDPLIEGGFEKGSTILTTGSAGTGKTILGLQFLYYGAKKFNEPGIFISFEEDRDSLFTHASVFNWDLEEIEKKKMMRVLQYKPHQVEKLIKEGGGPIRDAIRDMNAKRLVIDSLTAYSLLFKDDYQRRESILDLFGYLEKWGCTSIIISELDPKAAEMKEGSTGFWTDSIIALYYAKQEGGERVHSLEILKMRGTKHTANLLVMQFEKSGIKLYPGIDVF